MNKIKVARATKSRIETIKESLLNYELVYSIDTKELGVKNNDGTVTYIGVTTELNWGNILGKPTTFTPSTHNHTMANVTGLGAALDGKLDKNFSGLTNQPDPQLTDMVVINRDTQPFKASIGALLSHIDTEIFVIVQTLPAPAEGIPNKIYLVPKASGNEQENNTYEEFVLVAGNWETLGKFKIDLSDYYNKSQVDTKLTTKLDKAGGTATDLTVASGFQTPKVVGVDGGALTIEAESGILNLEGESGITAASGGNILFKDMLTVMFKGGSFNVDAYGGPVTIGSTDNVRVIAEGGPLSLEGQVIELKGTSTFTGIPTPSVATGAANKSYVDSSILSVVSTTVIDGGDL